MKSAIYKVKIIQIFSIILEVIILGYLSYVSGIGYAISASPKYTIIETPEAYINATFEEIKRNDGYEWQAADIYDTQVNAFINSLETINSSTYDFFNYPEEWKITTYRLPQNSRQKLLGFVDNAERHLHKINIATEDQNGTPIDPETISHTVIHEMIHGMFPTTVQTQQDIKDSKANASEIIYGTTISFEENGVKFQTSLFEEISAHLLEYHVINSKNEAELTYDDIARGSYGQETIKFINLLNSENQQEEIPANTLAMFMGVACMDEENAIKRFSELVKTGVTVNGQEYPGYNLNPTEVERSAIEFLKTQKNYLTEKV